MAGRFVRLMVVLGSAVLVAGCLSVNVDKTEHNSKDTKTSAEKTTHSLPTESAD